MSFNCSICTNVDIAFQRYNTAYIKHHDFLGSTFDCFAKRTSSRIVEVGYVSDFTTPAASYISSVSLSYARVYARSVSFDGSRVRGAQRGQGQQLRCGR